jgi:hypothetical protein
MAISALDRIKQIEEKAQKEIEAIKAEVVSEIAKRRSELLQELAAVDKQYQKLTGKTVRGERVSRKAGRAAGVKADFGSEKELEDLLKSADGHRISRKAINNAGFNLKSAMLVAKANQKKFGFQQKGPQGEIWLK